MGFNEPNSSKPNDALTQQVIDELTTDEHLPSDFSISKAVHDLASSHEDKFHEMPTLDPSETTIEDAGFRRGTCNRALISVANRPINFEKAMMQTCVTNELSLEDQKLLAKYVHDPT